MKHRPINKEILLTLRKGMPHGYLTTLARKTGFSVTYISRVMSGDYYNTIIIEEATRIYTESNSKTLDLINEIKRTNIV